MAFQKGIVILEGSIGDISFYQLKGKWVARRKGGPSAKQILEHANFARNRENLKEFGRVTQDAKVFRTAFQRHITGIADGGFVNRVTKAFHQVMTLDGTSPRGERRFDVGMKNSASTGIMAKLTLNENVFLDRVLHSKFLVDKVKRELVFTNLKGIDLDFPEGATQAQIGFYGARVDFDRRVFEAVQAPEIKFGPNDVMGAVKLPLPAFKQRKGHDLFLVTVRYFQKKGRAYYELKDARFSTGGFY